MSKTKVLTFTLPIEKEDDLTGFFLTRVELEGIEEASDGKTMVYIPSEAWTESLEQELRDFTDQNDSIILQSVGDLEEKDWNAEWESGIIPQRVTDQLIITPSWKLEGTRDSGAKYTIVIDPKMSFGTGHHETTRLCLQAIESLDVQGKKILDVGTGSGVLAIYTLQRGASGAVAIDTDQWSVLNAEENRDLNNVSPEHLDIRLGEVDAVIDGDERFDTILANIHRNILLELADRLATHLQRPGALVLSGLLVYDQSEVATIYQKAGFKLEQVLQENDWIALVLSLQ